MDIDSPLQALDLHLSAWEWYDTLEARHALTAFSKSYFGDNMPEVAYVANGNRLANIVYRDLNEAFTTYVDHDIADLAEQQGLAMPPDAIYESDVPQETLLIVLGKPWEYADGMLATPDRTKISIRALLLYRQADVRALEPDGSETKTHGLGIFMFVDHEGAAEIIESADMQNMTAPEFKYIGPLHVIDMTSWQYGRVWHDADEGEDHNATAISPHMGEMRRKILCLLRFMNEEIVRTERVKIPRPNRRRIARVHKHLPEDGTIISIHLRRYHPKDHRSNREAAEVYWAHRWWVRGHYRYNPKTGMKDIWVRPYLKPNDPTLPIVIKERIISVDR